MSSPYPTVQAPVLLSVSTRIADHQVTCSTSTSCSSFARRPAVKCNAPLVSLNLECICENKGSKHRHSSWCCYSRGPVAESTKGEWHCHTALGHGDNGCDGTVMQQWLVTFGNCGQGCCMQEIWKGVQRCQERGRLRETALNAPRLDASASFTFQPCQGCHDLAESLELFRAWSVSAALLSVTQVGRLSCEHWAAPSIRAGDHDRVPALSTMPLQVSGVCWSRGGCRIWGDVKHAIRGCTCTVCGIWFLLAYLRLAEEVSNVPPKS